MATQIDNVNHPPSVTYTWPDGKTRKVEIDYGLSDRIITANEHMIVTLVNFLEYESFDWRNRKDTYFIYDSEGEFLSKIKAATVILSGKYAIGIHIDGITAYALGDEPKKINIGNFSNYTSFEAPKKGEALDGHFYGITPYYSRTLFGPDGTANGYSSCAIL